MGNCISYCQQICPKNLGLKWPLWRKKLDATTLALPRPLRRYFPKESLDATRYGRFVPIISTIGFGQLPGYLLCLRKESQGTRGTAASHGKSPTFEPTIQTPALFGSMHVAFIVVFPDGLRWLLKIPANGYRSHFTDLEAESLKAEALTMQLLSRETAMSIPNVHAFDNSFENPINCPFIVMDFVDGAPLTEIWYDESISIETLETRRETILRELAHSMQEMNRFTSPQGGSPLFDDQKKIKGVGPCKELNFEAMWDNPGIPAAFHETGPFADATSFVQSLLPDINSAYMDGCNKYRRLLLLFIDWIPTSAIGEPDEQSFVLTHTDLDLQNILVSPDGHLISIIDWDGVAFLPRCLGNERYPEWLIGDWNPLLYEYDSRPGSDTGCQLHSDSPEDLSRYRSMYNQFVTEASLSYSTLVSSSQSLQNQHAHQTTLQALTSQLPAATLAHNSLLVNTLKSAADEYYCTAEIVYKIYDEIVNVQTKGEFKTSKSLPLCDRRKLWDITDMLEADAKATDQDDDGEGAEKVEDNNHGEDDKEKVANDEQQEENNDDGDEDDEDDGDEDEDDDEDDESEKDEQEAFKKRLEWVKEGFQKLFV